MKFTGGKLILVLFGTQTAGFQTPLPFLSHVFLGLTIHALTAPPPFRPHGRGNREYLGVGRIPFASAKTWKLVLVVDSSRAGGLWGRATRNVLCDGISVGHPAPTIRFTAAATGMVGPV